MSPLETTHFAAALISLVLGVLVLLGQKGTKRHRLAGRGFVAAMLVVNGAAMLSYEDGRFSVFHALAIVSLTTLVLGIVAIRRRRTADHAMWMCWTYAGLSAAGMGQLAVALGLGQSSVYIAIGGTVAIAYWVNNVRELPVRVAERLE